MNQYDAIVIGTGIGGLAEGLLLAHAGKKVALFEKNDILGGRFCSWKKDGFTLDMGVHVISRGGKGPLVEVLKRCGIEPEFSWINVRPESSTKGKVFKFLHVLKGMVPDEDYQAVLKFVSDIKGLSDEEMDALNDLTLEEYLNRYTTNDFCHSCISRIGSVYMGSPEWMTSGGEFARCMQWEAASRSSGYPEGGCGAVTRAYIDGVKKYGGEILPSCLVEKVIIEDGRAVGVVAGGKEYRAPIIVSNADVKRTVFDLVGEENLPADYVERIKNAPYSLSSPVIRCGLDTVLADPDKYKMCGTFYSGGSMHEYFDMLARKELPDEVNLFLVIPSNFDKGVAPEGKQLVMMATAVPFDLDEDFLNKLLDRMVDTAEGIIPGLREHALFMDVSTPKSVDGMCARTVPPSAFARVPARWAPIA